MSNTDLITFLLSFFFLINGASRGFMLSLLVPLSIITATLISIFYYQLTDQLIISLAIGLIGPFLLHLLFKFLLKSLAKSLDRDIKPSFLSRLCGAVLTLAWGWVFIFLTLILVAALPPWGKTLTAIHNDVTQSASYGMAKPWGEGLFTASKQNDAAVTSVSTSNDAKSIADDPRFQKVLQDPEIQKEIDAHDMVKLMSNPKMVDLTRQIMSDPATMKKVLGLYNSQTLPPAGDSLKSSNKGTPQLQGLFQ